MTEKAFLNEILALLRAGKADAAAKAIAARLKTDGGMTTQSGGVPPRPPQPPVPDEP